ncbi:uncharacterized protein LOC126702755 [Quercus robur]|uniref:uncharacterized protein LOC126702755 n=1 Tax=Quercus robur TaxID=38942 RepID=UPI00216144DC|nr:uncharacterized protein LOC126702755 [Quercus robur]
MHHVLVKVVEEDGFAWFLTCFYGWPETNQRFKSWALLNHLRSFVNGPWMCIGDFNAILSSSEKLSRRPTQARLIDDFQEALELNELEDLGYHGYQFTWNNKRPREANTRERLDRAVATGSWRRKFPLTTVTHLSSHASDHAPIILQTRSHKQQVRNRGWRGFKFEESWLLWEECEEVIKEAWEQSLESSSALEAIRQKIKTCGDELQAWGSSRTHPDAKEIKQLQTRVEVLQAEECTVENRAEFLEVSKKLDNLLRQQEIYWAQRSRVLWLKHGDKNTKFFHSKASQRQRRNSIHGIRDEENNWVEAQEDIARVAINYFGNLFSADFLNSGNTVSEINYTNIVLIPKVLANRLKQVLPQIISPTQSAFVPGRFIIDNVMVAYETLHTMHGRKKGKKGSLALKLDISKVYDRVEWDFLRGIMTKLGFPLLWINWVMTCITTPTFSVLINGKPFGHISPSRGLRQGDPLSPYLFLLCAEGFTALLAKAELEERIHGVSICRRAPRISHLLFADDSLLFCQATQREVNEVIGIIQTYGRASSQCINMEKSSVLFSSNTPNTQKAWVKNTLGVKEVERFETYLGLPTLIGRAKYHAFA